MKPAIEVAREFHASTLARYRGYLFATKADDQEIEDDLVALLERERAEAQAEADRPLEEAARALVEKLTRIHDDPAHKAVWANYMIHGAVYRGLTYTQELENIKRALKEVCGE